jgi:hypothetical protein
MYDESFIEALLCKAEGVELDFKSEQYSFANANPHQKSELLKDILAFANAWRRADAFILIGIKETSLGGPQLCGIAEHLDDTDLQQFVNSKTNRPINFTYTRMEFKGYLLAILEIPIQERPFFLSKDYGKVKKNIVYIRRGSSTIEASPDEVVKMGRDLAYERLKAPKLLPFIFREGHMTNANSTTHVVETTYLTIPEPELTPDYHHPIHTGSQEALIIYMGCNQDFYRDYAGYMKKRMGMVPFRLSILNSGELFASSIRLVVSIEDADETFEVMHIMDFPKAPEREPRLGRHILPWHGAGNADRHDIVVSRKQAVWFINFTLEKIHAKETVSSRDVFFIGAKRSSSCSLNCQIFADQLSSPGSSTITIDFQVAQKELGIKDFVK